VLPQGKDPPDLLRALTLLHHDVGRPLDQVQGHGLPGFVAERQHLGQGKLADVRGHGAVARQLTHPGTQSIAPIVSVSLHGDDAESLEGPEQAMDRALATAYVLRQLLEAAALLLIGEAEQKLYRTFHGTNRSGRRGPI
jgi:hypothetical protein